MPEQGEAVVTAQPAPEQVTDGGAQGEDSGEQQGAEPAVELEVLKERYKHSSAEGLRLHGENKELKQRLEALEKRSLTPQTETQPQKPPFPSLPDRDTYVKYWMSKDKTEQEAMAEYERDQWQLSLLAETRRNTELLAKRLQFENAEREKNIVELSPEAKKASEFWKDSEVMSALPISQQIQEMQKVMSKTSPQASGKDLSAIQRAAGGGVGGAARSAPVDNTTSEAEAKSLGFPSVAAMKAYDKVHTQREHEEWKARFKIK